MSTKKIKIQVESRTYKTPTTIVFIYN